MDDIIAPVELRQYIKVYGGKRDFGAAIDEVVEGYKGKLDIII